jgi:hypothetical protein
MGMVAENVLEKLKAKVKQATPYWVSVSVLMFLVWVVTSLRVIRGGSCACRLPLLNSPLSLV